MLLLLLFGCSPFPTDRLPLTPRTLRGITLVDWSAQGYLSPRADSAVRAIAATGASDIALLVTLYQPTVHSSEVHVDSLRTPSDSAEGR
jgi:hypothetical protein